MLEISFIAVEEAKPRLGFVLSSPGNGSCEGRNTGTSRGEVNPTLGKSPFVIHLCQRHLRFGGVHEENLLVVTELKLCVQGVNNWNWAVCLLEGNGDQKPGVGTRKEAEQR